MSSFSKINLAQLRRLIGNLDNRCSAAAVNNRVLKNAFHVIGHVLLNFVNTSLLTGQFPEQLKISTIVPVPKVASSSDACNFRPINTLPSIEKLVELAVYSQVSGYIDRNDILMVHQS